jgi:hypothetical protein
MKSATCASMSGYVAAVTYSRNSHRANASVAVSAVSGSGSARRFRMYGLHPSARPSVRERGGRRSVGGRGGGTHTRDYQRRPSEAKVVGAASVRGCATSRLRTMSRGRREQIGKPMLYH